MTANRITLNPFSIVLVLGKIALFVVVLSTVGQLVSMFTGHHRLLGLVPLFYLDRENNLPSYFSMLLLLLASAILVVITILEKKRAGDYLMHWAVLALGFFYMSIDEVIQLHEVLVLPVRKLLGNHYGSIFYFSWVVPAFVLVIFLALYFFKFLLYLSVKTRQTFLISAFIYLTGVLGVETIGGYHTWLHGTQNLTYLVLITVEESFEMVGIIMFIWSLLEYIADNFVEVVFQIEKN